MQRQLTNPMTMIQGSSKLALFIALGLAVAAGIVVFAILRSNSSEQSTFAAGTVTVITATEGIPAGARIEPGMLQFTEVSEEGLAPGALANPDLAIGQIARIPILEGEPVLAGKLTSNLQTGSGLSFIIPDGRRALGVRIDKVIGAGGLLRPGDRVDIYAVVSVPTFSTVTGEVVAEPNRPIIVAQDIEVLAVEQELQRVLPTQANVERTNETGGTLSDQADAQPLSSVVTLAVTPTEAQTLLLAEDAGSIRLALRGLGDDGIVATPEAVFSDVIADVSAYPVGEDTSLSYVVPVGLRAMAVAADKVIGAGGLIRPGDRVDVMAVLEVSLAIDGVGVVDGSARAVTLQQNVEVLAVEQALENLTPAEGATEVAGQPAAQPSATVVTLAVSPEIAQAIFLAEEEGSIRLSVRAPGDDEVRPIASTAFFSIRNLFGPVSLVAADGSVDLLGINE